MPPRPSDEQQREGKAKRARPRSRSASRSVDTTEGNPTPQRSPALQPSSFVPPPHRTASLPRSASASLPNSSSTTDTLSSSAGAAASTRPTSKRALKNKHKKARPEEPAPASTVFKSENSSVSNTRHTAAQSLLSRFSEVELQFQLEQDRAQRTTLNPRDVANLILWSVPAPVPLIESPRIFFIKNKSQVRNVAVIYVNGWSYDELLCTGIGLPRVKSSSSAKKADGQGDDGAATEDLSAHWDKTLCSSMLSAVRESRCWARPGRGSGCAGGVQYCPLFIPSTRNEMEKDLWWRNDAPRRPGENSSGSASKAARRGDHGDGDTVAVHRVVTPTDCAKGVGSLFNRALQVHAQESGAKATTAAAEASPTAITTSDAFQEHQHLWQDTALLVQYALKLPTHATELAELGFTLTPPDPVYPTSNGEEEEEVEISDKNADEMAENEREKVGDKESWSYFDGPTAVAGVAADEESADAAGQRPPKVFALDCEMVQVEGGESALARATLVNVQNGHVVLDMLVKPQQRITDYLTRFSGIDKAMLDPVNATLADCQAAMKTFIDTQTFVVGHSLENDFKACRFVPNCYVLDTAWLYPHPAGLPYKNALRFLAQKYLNRRIQQGSHDSAIDALVSAELTQLKLLNGPSFGIRPRVSVLGLVTAAASGGGGDDSSAAVDKTNTTSTHDDGGVTAGKTSTTTAPTVSAASTHTRLATSGTGLDVQVHLFDDAVTLTSLLPTAEKSAAGASPSSSLPPSHLGCIDAVPVRHDEDAMRKAVRALQRRSRQLDETRQLAQSRETRDGVETGGEGDKASFGLYWVQLTQTKVDVVLPSAPSSPVTFAPAQTITTGEHNAPDESHETTENETTAMPPPPQPPQPSSSPTAFPTISTLTPEQYTAVQQQVVHDTNRRVLRVVEACPDETLVIVLTGRCSGEAGGNHFSRAQGTCFAFIKDSSAPGPREEELTKKTLADGEGVEGGQTTAGEEKGVPLEDSHKKESTTAAKVGKAASSSSSSGHDSTPPACQQQ